MLEQPRPAETLGPLIAAAFIATLIGVGSANVVFLPMANRLKELSEEEMHFRELTLEGILAIQAGDNPRVVQEKLMTFVPPSERAPPRASRPAAAAAAEAGGLIRAMAAAQAAAQEAPPRGAREPGALARVLA